VSLGTPRLHLRRVDSTNERARAIAQDGAPHGALVTAAEQTAGRGRQGRVWVAPRGRALLMSVVLRTWPPLLPLAAGVAVAETAGGEAVLNWPNDVLLGGLKIAGILVEARAQAGWTVLGAGINVAVRAEDLPPELEAIAGTLGREPEDVEAVLAELLTSLERWLAATETEILEAVRARDALAGAEVSWSGGRGVAHGIDDSGRLLVSAAGGEEHALQAGEVHLLRPA
jgi:BirA family transcriptional regulator, biotin operon repressor / biotin---[acetyl-CoA-carboxylase] ligase